MLGMLAGHAGDVENDADDVDGLASDWGKLALVSSPEMDQVNERNADSLVQEHLRFKEPQVLRLG